VTIEGLVAVLLLLTILYCAKLNKQIQILRSDERAMRMTISELMLATESAERAIAGLKATVREAEEVLDTRLRDADFYSSTMAEHVKSGEEVLGRLRKIAYARQLLASADANEEDEAPVRPARVKVVEPKPEIRSETKSDLRPDTRSDIRSIAAAAQAFAERASMRVSGRAA
jgi:chromosome segregation ATPase